jgi:hypothetical protein
LLRIHFPSLPSSPSSLDPSAPFPSPPLLSSKFSLAPSLKKKVHEKKRAAGENSGESKSEEPIVEENKEEKK